MTRRSPMHDRYRVDRKGQTRKSASAAKPKREAGTASGEAPKKQPVKRSGRRLWGRGAARESLPRIPSTPETKRLRRVWWVLMLIAIGLALVMLPVAKMKNGVMSSILLGLYAAALGGAMYVEFGPMRRARRAALAEAKRGKKAPADKAETGGKGPAPVPDSEPAEGSASKAGGLFDRFRRGRARPSSDDEPGDDADL